MPSFPILVGATLPVSKKGTVFYTSDSSPGYSKRVITGRHPSLGSVGMVGRVDHEKARRASSGSIGDRIRDWMNRPAY